MKLEIDWLEMVKAVAKPHGRSWPERSGDSSPAAHSAALDRTSFS